MDSKTIMEAQTTIDSLNKVVYFNFWLNNYTHNPGGGDNVPPSITYMGQ